VLFVAVLLLTHAKYPYELAVDGLSNVVVPPVPSELPLNVAMVEPVVQPW
jgi:hypothetical protein